MRRFVFLNPAAGLGGAERSLVELIRAVGREFPDSVRHVILGASGPVEPLLAQAGATVEVLPLPRAVSALGDSVLRGTARIRSLARLGLAAPPATIASVGYVRQLSSRLAELAPHLIHSNGLKTHLLSVFASPRRVPVIWHIRDFLGHRPLMRAALRWVGPAAALAIANSHTVATDARRVLGRVPVIPIYNAIDVNEFAPGAGSPEQLDELAGLPPAPVGTIRVGLVATYARWKGQDIFLRALAAVHRSSVPIRGYVVGSAIYSTRGSQFSRAELGTMAVDLGIADRVGFVPFQSEPATIYRALDIVVHASTRPEPFGLTIAEAMSCGRPVIVAAAGGARELFVDCRDGVGVTPGDSAGLANTITRLAASPSTRIDLGSAARQSALARFSPERLACELAVAYQRVLKADVH